MYMALEGIFGVPIDVAATFIILFTIYGAFLDKSGAGQFFMFLLCRDGRKAHRGWPDSRPGLLSPGGTRRQRRSHYGDHRFRGLADAAKGRV